MNYPPEYPTGQQPPYYRPQQPNTQYPSYTQQPHTGYPPQQPYYAQQLPPGQVMFPANVGSGITCPYCHYTGPVRITRKISTGGWVCFVVLLLVFFPLCWIGLLMKTGRYTCGRCGIALGDRSW